MPASAPAAQLPADASLMAVLLAAARYLKRSSPSARLDAELLLAEVLHLSRLDLYLQFDRPLVAKERDSFRELVRRRSRGEPVAYILGRREFMGLELTVRPGVLIPRPETETLVEEAQRLLLEMAKGSSRALRVADVGTGSGAIALALAAWGREHGLALEVEAGDISPDALSVAGENARRLGFEGSVRLRQGDLLAPLSPPFDMICANLPYVAEAERDSLSPDVRDFEPASALFAGQDGLEAFRALLPQLRAALSRPGAVLLEIDPRRLEGLAPLLRKHLPEAGCRVVSDLAGGLRVVVLELP